MPVLEAILVTLLVLTAILYVTNVQRPLMASEAGGVDLSRLASETVILLQNHTFTDADGNAMDFEEWMQKVLDGDTDLAAQVEDFVREVLPTGTRSSLLLTNGVGSVRLIPATDPGAPRNARAAEVPFFPHWGKFRGNATTDAASAGWGAPGQNVTLGHPVLAKFSTTPSTVACMRAPDNSTTGPRGVPWTTLWRDGSGRIPQWALYGLWAGYTDAACTAGVQYARVALRDGTAADYPIYGARLVVWFGA